MHLSGDQAFRDVTSAFAGVSAEKGAKKTLKPGDARVLHEALNVLESRVGFSEVKITHETKALAEKTIQILSLSSDPTARRIVAVCSKVFAAPISEDTRPRAFSRARRDSLADTTQVRRLSIKDGMAIAEEMRSLAKNSPLSPRDIEFTKDELQFLCSMNQYVNREAGTHRPTEGQCIALAFLLRKACGNMQVNAQIEKMLNPNSRPRESQAQRAPIPGDKILILLKEFSFRTKDLHNPTESVKKLETLIEGFYDNASIADGDKMSLAELGAIESFRKCTQACDLIRDLNLDSYDKTNELGKIAEANHKAGLLIGRLENALSKRSNYRPGDIVSVVPERVAKLRSREETQKLQVLVQGGIPASHTAIVFRAEDGSEKLSHIVDKFQVDDFGLFDRLSSVTVRIDPMKLASQKAKDVLNQAEVTEKFYALTNKTHSELNPDTMTLQNSPRLKLKAGLTHLFPFLSGDVAKRSEVDRYQQFTDTINASDRTKMICSAWASLSQAAVVEQLNQELGAGSFNNPFPATKNLDRMTPGSVLTTLGKEQSSCLFLVEPEPLIKALVKARDLAPPPEIQALCIGGVNSPRQQAAAFEDEECLPPGPKPLERIPGTASMKWVSVETNEVTGKRISTLPEHELPALVTARRTEIALHTQKAREFIEHNPQDATHLRQYARGLMKKGKVKQIGAGTGSVYLISGKDKKTGDVVRLIVKPDDEGPLCLNNSKGNASPFTGNLLRSHIPLGNDAMRARLTFVIAESFGLHCTPKTEVALLTSDKFHDLTDGLTEQAAASLGKKEQTKVCSVQRFIKGATSIEDFNAKALAETQTRDITDDIIMDRLVKSVDKQSVEDTALLCCITGETDGNTGNLMLARQNEQRDPPQYKMMKVDNSLCWPDKNEEFSLCFQGLLPLTKRPLSDETVKRIHSMPAPNQMQGSRFEQELRNHGMSEKAIQAAKDRVAIMQQVASTHGATLEDLLISIQKNKNILKTKTKEDEAREQAEASAVIDGILAMGDSTFQAH